MNYRACVVIALILLIHPLRGQSAYELGDWLATKKGVEQALKLQDFERAVSLLQEVIETTENPTERAAAYILYADITTKSGDYDATNFYIQKAEKILAESPDQSLDQQLFLAKLTIKLRTGYAKEALGLATTRLKESTLETTFHVRLKELIGMAHVVERNFSSALPYYNEAITGYEHLKNTGDLSNALQNKALLLIQMGQFDSIEYLLNRSIELAKADENEKLKYEAILLTGKYYQLQGDYDAALVHLDIAHKWLETLAPKMLETRHLLALFYHELYEAMGNYEQALMWFKKAKVMEESLSKEDTALRAAFAESMQTIANQQTQLTFNKRVMIILAAVVLLIGAILYVQLRNLRIRSKLAKQMQVQNEALHLQRDVLVAQKNFIEERNGKLEMYLSKLEQLADSSYMYMHNTDKAFEMICRIVQDCLNVHRVSIWKYHSTDEVIRCNMLMINGVVSDFSVELSEHDYPTYFAAIKKKMLVVADDAQKDPTLAEFSATYLPQLGITSMLDAPFMLDGQLAGIMCCEHTGDMRTWQPEETIFLRAISDFVSVTLLTEKIRIQNQALKDSNVSLEDAVKMRTMELELQNKQLAEYAFINSHLLRAPLAKILGISDIMKKELAQAENKQLLDSMIASADELDAIIKRIGLVLHKGDHLTRDEIKRMEKNYPVD